MPKIRLKVYGGPIGHAMCRLPCDDVHATIDNVDVTIASVTNFVFSKSFCLEFGFRVGVLGLGFRKLELTIQQPGVWGYSPPA